jgi:hypothetical protein
LGLFPQKSVGLYNNRRNHAHHHHLQNLLATEKMGSWIACRRKTVFNFTILTRFFYGEVAFVNSSQNTQASTLPVHYTRSAALVGPAIELSYGNPGKRKRLRCGISTKPEARIEQQPRDPGVRKLIRYNEKIKTTFPCP